MKAFSLINPETVYLEIGQSSLKILEGEMGLELPLERMENGRLTAPCKENLISRLRGFLSKHGWGPRPRALCAFGARGVSMRRLTLPSASREELQRLLLLQIEREFPLPPDELAWGYKALDAATRNGGKQELLVVAVKKEVLKEYSDILSACGLNPVFTLGALARSPLCSQAPKSFAILDIGRKHSELACFENSVPTTLRVVQWGGENITESIQEALQVSRDEAEKLKVAQAAVPNEELAPAIQSATATALQALAQSLKGNWTGQKLYLAGRSAGLKDFSSRLAEHLGNGVECEPIEPFQGEGRSAAILGLKSGNGEVPSVILQVKRSKGGEAVVHKAPWRWAAVAGLMVLVSFALRYAEPLLLGPRLSQKLSQMKRYQEKLPRIDRELAFFQFLKTNQPPYLDGIWTMATAAPPGIRFDSLSMNRRGEVSLRGTLGDAQHVVDFRSKLIDSGLFSTVSVDEQTPAGDRKVAIRVSAHWKPSSERKALASSASGRGSEPAKIPIKETSAGPLAGEAPSPGPQRLPSPRSEVAVDVRTNPVPLKP